MCLAHIGIGEYAEACNHLFHEALPPRLAHLLLPLGFLQRLDLVSGEVCEDPTRAAASASPLLAQVAVI